MLSKFSNCEFRARKRYQRSKFLSKGFIYPGGRGGAVSRGKCRLRVAGTSPLLYWGANLEQGATCTRTGDRSCTVIRRTKEKESKWGIRTEIASALPNPDGQSVF